MSCGLCRDVCPAGVLAGTDWTIALETDGCVGCGLCAAACPTGALMVERCAPQAAASAGPEIVVECRRVAPSDRAAGAVVVPCLGGVTTPDLLDLIAAAEARVVLADRGWCTDCPIGACSAPWQPTLDETRAALAAIDERLAQDVAVDVRPLPTSRAAPVMAALRPDKQVGRRDILRRLIGAAEPIDPRAESRRVVFGRGLVAPVKRRRVLERIGALAAQRDQEFPASLLPAIKIADGCDVNGLCAAICPTGALSRTEDDGRVTLGFEASACIACGECQRVCPGKALSLWRDGDGSVPQGRAILVQRRAATCESCGESFVPAGDELLCSFCRKTMNVMAEISSLKNGLRVASWSSALPPEVAEARGRMEAQDDEH
jgi:ferredoxin